MKVTTTLGFVVSSTQLQWVFSGKPVILHPTFGVLLMGINFHKNVFFACYAILLT